MDKGYVYIARIIDHGGKFVNGYHKIGLSKQYKIRQTQLNSTHLPFDVLMVRVFETEEMLKIESLLHLCFEDYRVVKEYDFRKNITTEWFDVSDIDVFNERINKLTYLMNIQEIDLNESIDRDNSLTDAEKNIEKNKVGFAKASKIKLIINGVVSEDANQKTLMSRAYKYVCDKIGHEQVRNFDRLVTSNPQDFKKWVVPYGFEGPLEQFNGVVDLGDSYLWTVMDAKTKKKNVDRLCENFKIDELSFEIV